MQEKKEDKYAITLMDFFFKCVVRFDGELLNTRSSWFFGWHRMHHIYQESFLELTISNTSLE